MADDRSFVRPIQQFDDNIRPANLLLHVYRLLDCQDDILTGGDFVEHLRGIVQATTDEDLMVVRNEIFLGLVREAAQIPPSALKQRALCHLLRQAIVASCTALDAYLPALLRVNLPTVIQARRRAFLPTDEGVKTYFEDLTFSLEETLRLLDDEGAYLFITNRILGTAKFKYLSDKQGVHVTGALLGIPKPWEAIALHLGRDRKELITVLEGTVRRRNDIVHRADRSLKDPDGEQQPITYVQARQGTDIISHLCHALNELVEEQMRHLQVARLEAAQ